VSNGKSALLAPFSAATLALGVAACGSTTSGALHPIVHNTAGSTGGASGDAGGEAGTEAGAAGAPSVTSDLHVIVEPSDDATGLVDAIQNAQSSVHMTMYLLTSSSVIHALIAQRQAGHEVEVLLNKTFPSGTGNQSSYSQLANAGVPVHWAPSGFTYTHEKCVIVDGREAWIMTMNATFTSPTDNREYLAVDDDAADVAEADAIFRADYAGQPIAPTGKLLVSPDNARADLVALFGGAHNTLDVEAEELSDSAIVSALESAADRGVQVRIVLATGSTSSSQATAVADLKQHKVALVTLQSPYIHAKSAVADGTLAYVGSENFSYTSLSNNRELGVIFDTPSEVAKVEGTIQTDFAAGAPQ
jgi:cardiolipin synthase A/B